jgi:hypothetical protein
MVSEKELQSVSGLGAFDRYRYFIKKIADSQELWTLKNGDGDFALAMVEEKILLPLWSAREYIKSCLYIWEDYIPLLIILSPS